jgi:ubiquinol oxidase
VAIRDDEMEHVKTMHACQQPHAQQQLLSPHAAQFLSLENGQKEATPELVGKS